MDEEDRDPLNEVSLLVAVGEQNCRSNTEAGVIPLVLGDAVFVGAAVDGVVDSDDVGGCDDAWSFSIGGSLSVKRAPMAK